MQSLHPAGRLPRGARRSMGYPITAPPTSLPSPPSRPPAARRAGPGTRSALTAQPSTRRRGATLAARCRWGRGVGRRAGARRIKGDVRAPCGDTPACLPLHCTCCHSHSPARSPTAYGSFARDSCRSWTPLESLRESGTAGASARRVAERACRLPPAAAPRASLLTVSALAAATARRVGGPAACTHRLIAGGVCAGAVLLCLRSMYLVLYLVDLPAAHRPRRPSYRLPLFIHPLVLFPTQYLPLTVLAWVSLLVGCARGAF